MDREGIGFTDEILKRVASKHKVELGKVLWLYKTLTQIIHTAARDEPYSSIFLTWIGTLHLSRKVVQAHVDKPKGPKKKLWKQRLKDINELQDKLSMAKRFRSVYHNKRRRIDRLYYTDGYTIEEIEQIQNNQ